MALSGSNIASKTPSRPSKTPPRASKTPSRTSKTPPKRLQDALKNLQNVCLIPLLLSLTCQVSAKFVPSHCQIAKYARDVCPQWSSTMVYSLRRTWPSTKGGLAVVRPRRASSIRQTTLVSGRVQDIEQILSSSKI